MDYTTCAVPFIGCFCFLLGIWFHAWCMREPKPKQEQPPKTLLARQVNGITKRLP